VVASNVGGIPDLVKHNLNGLLVPPGDEKALAAAIRQLINDPEKAKMMGQCGREFCHQFSVEAMVEKLDNLYQELFKFHRSLRLRHREHREEIFFPDREVTIKEKAIPK
jgi:glycosyltransferase involved in cell wall biosynthesis